MGSSRGRRRWPRWPWPPTPPPRASPVTAVPSPGMRLRLAIWGCVRSWTWGCGSARVPAPCWPCRWCRARRGRCATSPPSIPRAWRRKANRRNHGPVPARAPPGGPPRRCRGGGAVASRRIPALLDAGADVLLVSPKVAASLEDLAAAGRIRWEPRGYRPGDCAGAWLVCACTDDSEVNAAVAAAAEAQRTWYVRADDAGASAAWTPASGRAGDVRIGVLSGDPRHSAAIRDAVVAGLQSGRLSARHG